MDVHRRLAWSMKAVCDKIISGLLLAVVGTISLSGPALRGVHLRLAHGPTAACGASEHVCPSHSIPPQATEHVVCLLSESVTDRHADDCTICHYFAQVQLAHTAPAGLLTAVLSSAQAKHPAPSRVSRCVEPYSARGPPATV